MDANKKKLLEEIQLFVLDMDGTFYMGDHIIEGALDFIRICRERGKRFLFFTNNSSQSPENYIIKLGKMGCEIERDQIMTSGDAFLKQGISGGFCIPYGNPSFRGKHERVRDLPDRWEG